MVGWPALGEVVVYVVGVGVTTKRVLTNGVPREPLASSGPKAGAVRRAGYGASGVGVGALGGRTRQLVLDTALGCFAAEGFHQTVMEDIAAKAGVSRATLYQYFASKEAIFLELVEVGGGDFLVLAKSAGPFGGGAPGFENLMAWVTAWSSEVNKYSALFVEWSNVNARKASLRPRLAWFVERHTSLWSKQLAGSDLGIVSAETMAVLMLSVADRYNYMRLVYQPAASDAELAQNLGLAFQRVLFPADEAASGRTNAKQVSLGSPNRKDPFNTDLALGSAPSAIPVGRNGKTTSKGSSVAEVSKRSDGSSEAGIDPFAGLTQQAKVTVRKLLDASGRVFANNGYSGSNVDLIVGEAGLARGTFYKYFKERTQLLAILAQECAASLVPALAELGEVAMVLDSQERSARLRILLDEFLRIQHLHSAVLRAWLEQHPNDPAVLAPYLHVRLQLRNTVAAMLGNAPADEQLHLEAAAMMFAALLERFPEESTGTRFTLTDTQIIEAQALFLERAFFAC